LRSWRVFPRVLPWRVVEGQRQTAKVAANLGFVAIPEGEVEDAAAIAAMEIAHRFGNVVLDESGGVLAALVEDACAEEPELGYECALGQCRLQVPVECQSRHLGPMALLVARVLSWQEARGLADGRGEQRVTGCQPAVQHRDPLRIGGR